MRLRRLLLCLVFLTGSVYANVDPLEVERIKEIGRDPHSYMQSLAVFKSSTAREFCTAIYELRRDGEYSAVRALEWDQSIVLGRKGYEGYLCPENLSEMESWQKTSENSDGVSELVTEVYNIDLLKIETAVTSEGCIRGSEVRMTLTGMIGPDSSFAMDKLLEQMNPCRDSDGNIIKQVKLNISSGGGLLNDGYKLGKTLKKYNVRAIIKNDTSCASSCAVAFLGAASRVVEEKGQIMFHAPYFSGKNEYGEKDIDCNVGKDLLDELKDYYVSMTDKETGERLFERTMWYCSANDGWVVTGGAAAELYGIATER